MKKYQAVTDNLPITICVNKIENGIKFRIKKGDYLDILTLKRGDYLETLKVRLLKMKIGKIGLN